jgi:hypothetical protein
MATEKSDRLKDLTCKLMYELCQGDAAPTKPELNLGHALFQFYHETRMAEVADRLSPDRKD